MSSLAERLARTSNVTIHDSQEVLLKERLKQVYQTMDRLNIIECDRRIDVDHPAWAPEEVYTPYLLLMGTLRLETPDSVNEHKVFHVFMLDRGTTQSMDYSKAGAVIPKFRPTIDAFDGVLQEHIGRALGVPFDNQVYTGTTMISQELDVPEELEVLFFNALYLVRRTLNQMEEHFNTKG